MHFYQRDPNTGKIRFGLFSNNSNPAEVRISVAKAQDEHEVNKVLGLEPSMPGDPPRKFSASDDMEHDRYTLVARLRNSNAVVATVRLSVCRSQRELADVGIHRLWKGGFPVVAMDQMWATKPAYHASMCLMACIAVNLLAERGEDICLENVLNSEASLKLLLAEDLDINPDRCPSNAAHMRAYLALSEAAEKGRSARGRMPKWSFDGPFVFHLGDAAQLPLRKYAHGTYVA